MYTITLYKNRQMRILKSFLDSTGNQKEIVQIVQGPRLQNSFAVPNWQCRDDCNLMHHFFVEPHLQCQYSKLALPT